MDSFVDLPEHVAIHVQTNTIYETKGSSRVVGADIGGDLKLGCKLVWPKFFIFDVFCLVPEASAFFHSNMVREGTE